MCGMGNNERIGICKNIFWLWNPHEIVLKSQKKKKGPLGIVVGRKVWIIFHLSKTLYETFDVDGI